MKVEDIVSSFSFLNIVHIEQLLFFIFAAVCLILMIFRRFREALILNLSIKKFIILVISFEFIIIVYLLLELITLNKVQNNLTDVNFNKFKMISLADKLRQSSDDLTHYARTYTITNDKKYKDIYYQILDIRNGKKPRPAFYEAVYWDLNKKLREQKHPSTKKISFHDLINELPYSKEELDLLKLSEYNSNDLVNLEIEAFKAMDKNQSLAIKLLHSKEYYRAKEKIMLPIDEMILSLYDRTDRRINVLKNGVKEEFKHVFLVVVFFIISNVFIYLIIVRKIEEPITYITDEILKFKLGKKNTKKVSFYKDEIGDMNNEFFSMKDAIEKSQKELKQTIVDLKDTQNKLIEADKMASLGGLVAGVAHEINTPVGIGLTGITHFSSLTQKLKASYEKNDMSEDEFKNYLKTSEELAYLVTSNLKKTAQLVKSFKRVAVEQTNEEKKEFNLKSYLQDIVLSLGNMIKKNRINIEIICEEDIVLNTYAGVFSQVITNLIINSIRHGFKNRDKGNIKIFIEKLDTECKIIYKDDGSGIEKENLTKIFNPFFTTNRNDGGTGLGLNIVLNIVTNTLNGTITCSSEVDEGVEFIITI